MPTRFLILMLALCWALPASAQLPARFPRFHDPYDPAFEDWAMSEVRAVVEENFAAVNAEDIERLMATHTSDCPGREEFQKESEQAFKEFDVYVRLVDLRWGGGSNASTGYKEGHRCAVVVTQQTLPAHAEDGDYTAYRGNSALLPETELVYYTLHCHMEDGKWKIHMINGHVNATTWEYFEADQRERAKNQPKRKAPPAPQTDQKPAPTAEAAGTPDDGADKATAFARPVPVRPLPAEPKEQ